HEEDVKRALETLISEDKVFIIGNMYMHINQYNKLKENTIKLLSEYHKKYRLRKGILKEEVRSKIESNFKTREMDILLEKLSTENAIKIENNIVSLLDFEVILNDKQKEIAKKIEKRLKSCGVSSILTIDEVSEGNHNYAEVLESMIGNKVEKLDDLYIMDKDIYENAKNILINYIKENKEITLGEYRDLIDSSRKNCMIILENFDRNKITKRVENKRILF
ncbi:SelB C-terminal domain-containing protein, partial [Clostridioides difficile]|nr:SelB C-terminal domain-containing protein [Clostridioides difficile]